MEPTGKISPQPWMSTPETCALMAALKDAKIEARFIGGCVRDSILKLPIKDIDIATPTPPEKVMVALGEAGIKAIPTGIKHGTITAVINTHHFEITTLRIDVETDGRRAKVAFTDDWTKDAARRDFTINAMSANEQGDVFDPYDGLDDLSRRKIRFVGRAENRINEDVLRLLRFFRFYAEYGRPPADKEALSACRKLAPRLKELSGERVRGELLRILMAPNPADTITMMRGEKILEHVLPQAGDVGRLRALAWLTQRGIVVDGIEANPICRLGALIKPGTSEKTVGDICDRLKFSNRERRHLLIITNPPDTSVPFPLSSSSSEEDIRKACYILGKDMVIDHMLIGWAGEIALDPNNKPGDTKNWEKVLIAAAAWQPVEFPLKGRDGLELGLKPGPELGQHLDRVEKWWADNNYLPNHDACLVHLKQILNEKA